MAKLSAEQMRFLEKHFIPLSRVFDASGMSKREREHAMKELDMLVAIGVSPCSKGGHTMKTRSGHCPQCGTHNLAFLRRHEESGSVYVAVSKSIGLVKVGAAGCPQVRLNTLNQFGYGGASDWKISFSVECNKAGKVEYETQKLLRANQVSRSYLKSGSVVDCLELFDCKPSEAEQAIVVTLRKLGLEAKPKTRGAFFSIGIFGVTPLPLPPDYPIRRPKPLGSASAFAKRPRLHRKSLKKPKNS